MRYLSAIIQMKATKHYFPVVLFIMLHKVVLTLDSLDEILNTRSYGVIWAPGVVYCAA